MFRTVDEKDWANEWKQYFHVTRVGKRFVIKPSWEHYEPGDRDIVLELDPGMAFGTGTHPTTTLCLEGLEEVVKDGDTVFDVGTGSGILAMAAVRLGAGRVRAVDIDGVAVRSAAENIAKSGLSEKIEVRKGDLLHGTEGKADVIVANILANIIKILLPDVPGKLKEDGVFLAAGIIEEARQEVEETAAACGLAIIKTERKGDWVSLLMKKA